MKNKQVIIRVATVIVSALLIIAAYALIVGDGTIFKGNSDGETLKAKVIRVTDVVATSVNGESEIVTVSFKAQVLGGERRGKTVDVIQEIDKTYAFSPRQVEQNDKILIEGFTEGGETLFYFGDYVRITPLIWLLVIFCVLIVAFSKMQGFKTIISLGFTCLAVFCVLIPAILNGHNIYFWAILVCIYITVMTLLIISGYNKKALCAGIGCVSGVMCSGLVVLISDKFLNMTGLLEEESVYLYQLYPDNPIDLKAIIFAMITIGALGAVMDVSVSISSSLKEIHDNVENPTFGLLVKSGVNIGRDIMGTMANTLVLAYIGCELSATLLQVMYSSSPTTLFSREKIVAELLQALVGSIGILLTIPLTAVVSAALYTGGKRPKKSRKEKKPKYDKYYVEPSDEPSLFERIDK